MSRRECLSKAGPKKVAVRCLLLVAAALVAALVLTGSPVLQASPGMSVQVNLSTNTDDNHDPQIALDSKGHPHVVWRGNDGSANNIYYSANLGAGWSTPLMISPGSTDGKYPEIVLDSGDNPHVAWMGYDVTTYRVYYTADLGAGWSAPRSLSSTITDNEKPHIALDAGDHPHVIWDGKDGSTIRIYYSANLGAGWSAPLNLSPGSTGNFAPQFALDAGGHPHVVWFGYDAGPTYRIWYSANSGAGWSTPLNLSPGTTSNSAPQIALDSSGHPQVVWRGKDATDYRIWFSSNPGSGWSAPVSISGTVLNSWEPQIALSSSGRPHVVWYGSDGSTDRIWYSSNPGSGWSAPANLSPASTLNYNPRMVLDTNDHPYVVWFGSDGSTDRIYYSSNLGPGWLVQQNLSTGSTGNFYPEIALDLCGNPHVVWDGHDGSTELIWYSADIKYDFYFAEGYTGAGFQEYLCLGNSGDAPLEVAVTYLFADGTPSLDKIYTVPKLARFTADVNTEVGADKNVSIRCEALSPFVAERPMYFSYAGGPGEWTGGSDAVGANRTSRNWYFAEGYTGPGFDEWVCVFNPGDNDASLTFNFQTQEDGLVVPTGTHTVPAHSRGTFKANDLLGGKDYQTSLALASDVPVVAERPMYFDYQGTVGWGWTGGHDVLGVPALGRDYYFAEGTTRSGFEEWLTLQNPGAAEITVSAVYQLGEGTPVPKEYKVPAGFRKTVYVPDEVGAERDVSVHLSSSSVFLAERPMYFNYREEWTGGHCVIGAASPGAGWFFAEGYTGEGFEEWLCIQNPGATAAHVSITYYPQGGGAPIVKDPITVAANSRATVFVNTDAGEGLSICAKVTSDQPVIVERPMYFNFDGIWDGGSDVVGYQP